MELSVSVRGYSLSVRRAVIRGAHGVTAPHISLCVVFSFPSRTPMIWTLKFLLLAFIPSTFSNIFFFTFFFFQVPWEMVP